MNVVIADDSTNDEFGDVIRLHEALAELEKEDDPRKAFHTRLDSNVTRTH